MHRIDHTTADPNKNGAGLSGWTEGSPPLVPPTQGTEAWFNDVQENLATAITSTGMPLVKGEHDQLFRSLIIRDTINAACNIQDAQTGIADQCTAVFGTYEAWTNTYAWTSLHWNGKIRRSIDLVSWEAVTSPTTDTLVAMASSGPIQVIVGVNGRILYRNEGEWSARTVGTSSFNDVCWSEALGLWIAVGLNGTIFASADGIVWQPRFPGTTSHFRGVAASPDAIVAITTSDTLYRSTDAVTWTPISLTDISFFRCVEYLGGKFVVGARLGPNSLGPISLTSMDGLSWTIGEPLDVENGDGENEVFSVTYLNGVYIGTASVPSMPLITSLDGLRWTPRFNVGHKSGYRRVTASHGRLALWEIFQDWTAVGRSLRVVT